MIPDHSHTVQQSGHSCNEYSARAQTTQKLCKNSKKRDTVPTNASFFAKSLFFPSKIPKNEEMIISVQTIT